MATMGAILAAAWVGLGLVRTALGLLGFGLPLPPGLSAIRTLCSLRRWVGGICWAVAAVVDLLS